MPISRIFQRQKLDDLGLLNVKREIRIVGTPLSDECDLGNCVIDGEEKKDDESFGNNDNDTKIVHFQRHGQGYHNLICDIWRETGKPIDFDSPDPNLNPVVRPEFCDPPLTALGNAQCSSQRPLCSRLCPELIIVSPMLRCIQTAKLSFRDHEHIRWVSHEGCREELGLLQGNKRRSITEIREDYPEIDFTAIEFDHDKLWEDYGDRELFGTRDLQISIVTHYVCAIRSRDTGGERRANLQVSDGVCAWSSREGDRDSLSLGLSIHSSELRDGYRRGTVAKLVPNIR